MGVLYELNWYLVVGTENDLLEREIDCFVTTKSDKRFYPIGAPIPLIVKSIGCMGMVEVTSFKVDSQSTTIEFVFTEHYEPDNVIAMHYFSQYKAGK